MGSPADDPADRVDVTKHAAPEPGETADTPFDPYRFGAPDVPPPPEYAPPGYQPPPGYQYPATPPPATGAGPPAPYPPYPYGTTHPGQPPYGGPPGYPYGAPPYGSPPSGYGPGAPSARGNGKAVAALVLGIVSIALFWTTIFDVVFVLPAVILGFLGLGDARERGGRGRGQALAGLICAAVGAVLAIVFLIVAIHLAGKCGGISNQDDPGFQQCVRDQF